MNNIIFIGTVRWRYRTRHIWYALKVLWMAVKGYHLSPECHDQKCEDIAM